MKTNNRINNTYPVIKYKINNIKNNNNNKGNKNKENIGYKEEEWCHYGGLPSPMAYVEE